MASVKIQYVYYSKQTSRDKNRITGVTFIVFRYNLPQDSSDKYKNLFIKLRKTGVKINYTK